MKTFQRLRSLPFISPKWGGRLVDVVSTANLISLPVYLLHVSELQLEAHEKN
jgi:hypothetical protein